jgi:hypothetical protein
MTVQCPNCGHSGTLPSNMESGQHKIRCRRCGVKFESQPKAAEQKVDAEPEIDPKGLPGLATELGIEPESQSEEEDSVTGVGDLKIDVSDDELPVPSERLATLPPEPWYYGFLDGWGVFYLYAAGFTFCAALLTFALALINARANDGGLSVLVAIVGFVVVALFGTVLVTCAAVIFLIVDQARNVRQLHVRPERLEKA